MQFVPLNLNLMSHPANWIIVTLMVLLGGFALSLLTSISPADTSDDN